MRATYTDKIKDRFVLLLWKYHDNKIRIKDLQYSLKRVAVSPCSQFRDIVYVVELQEKISYLVFENQVIATIWRELPKEYKLVYGNKVRGKSNIVPIGVSWTASQMYRKISIKTAMLMDKYERMMQEANLN